MHRLLLTSTAWRQTSRRDSLAGDDADNRWIGRMPVRRLEAEALRDRFLAASGQLSSAMYGPAVAIKEDDVGQVVVSGDDTRRSIYLQVRRSQPLALLTTFDAPVMETNCDRRISSTVAPQSLLLMNSEFMQRQAAALARRSRQAAAELTKPAAPPLAAQLTAAWRFALGRAPTPDEWRVTEEFVARQLEFLATPAGATSVAAVTKARPEFPGNDLEAIVLMNVCQTLMSGNEFLYVD
jgi:hypothetical protein